ncbi:Platinum sensitivity protein, partial [Rhizophlyctis rosea]
MASDQADQPVVEAVGVDGALADSSSQSQETEGETNEVTNAQAEGATGESQDENRRRVKVYELPEGASEWEAKGTGNVECLWVEAKDAMCLVVRSEENQQVLMNAKIRAGEDVYNRQQETLIVWVEPNKTDLALSFQQSVGCDEVWDQIQTIQKRIQADKHDIDQLPTNEHQGEQSLGSDELPTTVAGIGGAPMELPAPTMANLCDIDSGIVRMSRSMYMRDLLVGIVTENGWLERLLDVFQECEDLESLEDLYVLSTILRNIISLNDTAIYEIILKDEAFTKVVGILEYDREWPNMEAKYREHIESKVKFKQVIPIQNEDIKAKITQTYRVLFLKDVVLARHMDDGTFSTLNSLVFFNQMDIVSYIQQDHEYLKELFRILGEGSGETRSDAVAFLRELCFTSKNLQSMSRGSFFRALAQHGLFNSFESILSDPSLDIRLAACAILTNVLDHDPQLLRSFIIAQDKEGVRPLIDVMIERFIGDDDEGIRTQIADLLQKILDTSPLDASEGIVAHGGKTDREADEFLNYFYEKHVSKLMAPVADLDSEAPLVQRPDGTEIYPLGKGQPATCHFIVEFLCFAVKSHGFRSKYVMLGKDVLRKVTLLLKARDTYLRLTAVRLIRVCVGLKEEFYIRYLIKIDAFRHVLLALRETNGRYNMLNSACVELFEFIRKENQKAIIAHIVNNHRQLFEDVKYVDTFHALVVRHEQNEDAASSKGGDSRSESATPQKTKPRDGWERADDDESYFNSPDDEEESASSSASPSEPGTNGLVDAEQQTQADQRNAIQFVKASASSKGLVDYPDEDEEEDLVGMLAKKKTG